MSELELKSDLNSGFKRLVLGVMKAVSAVAAAVFFFMPLRTFTQVLLCLGSLLIFVFCSAVSTGLDAKETGYWPGKPEDR
jgi:hypothetical protein